MNARLGCCFWAGGEAGMRAGRAAKHLFSLQEMALK